MERAKLIVKNFGPLKDIEIEVREMVTFIGAQASGKSTLAKLISILEDESFRNDSKISFNEELKKYNIFSYLNQNTYINYEVLNKEISNFNFEYTNNEYIKNSIQHLLSVSKKGKILDADIKEVTETLKKLIASYINLHNLINRDEFFGIFTNQIQRVKFEIHFQSNRLRK